MLNAHIFRTNVILAAFSSYMYIVKAAETTFVQKIRTFNVDEIDGWCKTMTVGVFVVCTKGLEKLTPAICPFGLLLIRDQRKRRIQQFKCFVF
jgi:hypothetical protein